MEKDPVTRPDINGFWSIGLAIFLCCITLFATRYGRVVWYSIIKPKPSVISRPKTSLETFNDTKSSNDGSVSVTQRLYDEVHVLLVSWQGADARFYKQLIELRNVFRDYYNYEEGDSTAEDFFIPSDDSKNALDDKLSEFLEKDGPRNLLILYYGGHGAINVSRRAIWKKFEKDGPEVPWHDLQTKLFERKSDVLLLIDCCAAAGSRVPVGTRGMVEVEFAGGFEASTPIWGPHSFTTNLVAELKKVHDTGISVLDLHTNLSNTLQHYRPQQDGREKRANPHHDWLARSELRSIHLQSLLSTAPAQLQNAARTQTTSLHRARSFDIVKLQAKIREIQRWLEPMDQSKFHNSAVAAQEKETGGWILQHNLIKEWKYGTRAFLVIYGTAGCGKTVLCASIANHLEASCRSQDMPNQRDLLAKFYFSFENFSQQQNLESLLKSMIQQLSFAPEIFSVLRALFEENAKTWPPSSPPISNLQELLVSGLKERCSNTYNPRHVFLVIDALDEVPKGTRRDEVFNFLMQLVSADIPFLHVLVTCRPKTDIKSRLSGTNNSWAALYVDKEAIRSDIGIYVNKVLQSSFELLHDDAKQKIRDRLTGDRDGMFRWAKLQIESLKRLEPATPEAVEAALAVLPPDLDASYLNILMEINPVHRQQAKNALSWLCLASRPLFIEEIIEVCATFPDEDPGFRERFRLPRQEYVLDILKDLITVDPPLDSSSPSPGRNIVKLAHFSVKEYLTGPEIGKSAAALYEVTASSNKFIAKSCLVYLFYNNSYLKREESYCLRDYAWNQWAWHGVRAVIAKADILEARIPIQLELAIQLFDSLVYTSDPSPGFETLRELGLLDWLDRRPNQPAVNLTFQAALRNPYFYGEFTANDEHNSARVFEHQKLLGPLDIRLVKILPSEYDSPEIRCKMVHASLDQSLDQRAQYDAISYTWSYEPERSSYIRLNGKPYSVRGKVATILRTLRSTNNNRARTVWIDGLCIDMMNLEERSSQVNLMANIYSQAKEVAVILEDDGIDPKAIRILEELDPLLANDDFNSVDLDGVRSIVGQYSSEDIWRIILDLFSQKWWGRMWPIQEIVLGPKVTIIYGKMPINFDIIQRVMIKEKSMRRLLRAVYRHNVFEFDTETDCALETSTWNRARSLAELRTVMQERGRVELPHLLFATRFSGVTFSPDRVFSLYPLSLIGLGPTAASSDMVIDYTLSAQKVFMNCSKYLLQQYRNLDSFSYVTHCYGDQYYILPTWASTFMSDHRSGRSQLQISSIIYPPHPLVKGKFQPLDGEDLYAACGLEASAIISFKVESKYPNVAAKRIRELWEQDGQLLYLVLEGILVDRIADTKILDLDYGDLLLNRSDIVRSAADFFQSFSNELDTNTCWKTIVVDQWEIGKRGSSTQNGFSSGETDERNLNHKKSNGLKFVEGRSIFGSYQGRIGLGPSSARTGDFIMVLPGGKVPYIFRDVDADSPALRDTTALPAGRKSLPDLHLVGECYVDGIMDGEVLRAAKAGKYEFQEVRII